MRQLAVHFFAYFLALRVLWKHASGNKLLPSGLLNLPSSGSGTIVDDARKRLKDFDAFQAFLSQLRQLNFSTARLDEENLFRILQHYHQSVIGLLDRSEEDIEDDSEIATPLRLRTRSARAQQGLHRAEPTSPTPIPSGPVDAQLQRLSLRHASQSSSESGHETSPEQLSDRFSTTSGLEGNLFRLTPDEQVVNMSLLLLLNLLTLGAPGSSAVWIFTARTDGYLKMTRNGNPAALIECKANVRMQSAPKVLYQEAAQMSAWILLHPDEGDLNTPLNADGKRRRVGIAQNQTEIYVNVGEFTNEYVEFLHGSQTDREFPAPKRRSGSSFMTMTSYGPFDITNPAALKEISIIVLALTLAQSR
ncbi:hypothetical protein K461DRAFT_316509 [Myriangium duriaei CBS 260.36]|uniref:TLDc domain-containing protein n=1 Tax=Myriangium duriaei CBS 260.36 TaxID=1168546 RepID=A0A9P4IQA5_9PEZI|nr:hypothetical protein K461DRAFT_316509 [Myriangium duriaei CBS 260.36]